MATTAQSLFRNFQTSEDVIRGQLVYLSGPGTVAKALAASETTMPAMGMAQENGTSGNYVSVLLAGAFEDYPHAFASETNLFVSDVSAGGLMAGPPINPASSRQNAVQVHGPNTLMFIGTPGFIDEQAKISKNDLVTGFLNDKLLAGSGITFSILSPSGDERLEISANTGSGGFFGTPMLLSFGKNSANVQNKFLDTQHAISSNATGYRMIRNGTINALSWQGNSTAGLNGDIQIKVNGTTIITFPVTSGESGNQDITFSSNFNAGDIVSCYLNASKISEPLVIMEIIWR